MSCANNFCKGELIAIELLKTSNILSKKVDREKEANIF